MFAFQLYLSQTDTVIIPLLQYITFNFFPAVKRSGFASVFQEAINLLHCLQRSPCIVQAKGNGSKDSLN